MLLFCVRRLPSLTIKHASTTPHTPQSYRTVDYTDLAAVSAAASQASTSGCNHPRIIAWVETPSNPLLKVTDVTAVAAAVREAVSKSSSSSEAVVVVDSTWLTPALMRPLVECGADLVVHSTTK